MREAAALAVRTGSPSRRRVPPKGGGERGCALRDVQRWQDGHVERDRDRIAEEVPVALVYNDRPHVVMMATPGDFEDFAIGFSVSEAIVANAAEVGAIAVTPLVEGIEVKVRIPAARAAALARRQRNLTGRTGCGLCGAQALEDAVRQPSPVAGGIRVAPTVLRGALAELQERQPLNLATGATHAAAFVRPDGTIVLVREDVGRHNALDKLIGALFRAGIEPATGFLIVTSRASYEMVQKAATAGATILVAVSAPTTLAIQLAHATGLTLVGFARATGHVVYTGGHRVGIADEGWK